MRYSVLSFGCRVNQAESLAIEAALRERGLETAEARDADLVVVNSCSVTAAADQGTRQAIRKLARENPSARLVVTGCYATRRPDEVAALPGVLRVIANGEKDHLVAAIGDLLHPAADDMPTTADRYAGEEGPCGAPGGHGALGLAPGAFGRTAFTLRVQTGCDEQCAYCIIPSTRGLSRSTPVAGLVADVGRIEQAGYREVTLTGVHLGAYGRDLAVPSSLAELVARLIEATSGLIFRLGSLEPMDCPRALLDLAVAWPRLTPAFHLPLQHASDRILAAMRRPYSRAQYAALVDEIRTRIPHAAITADVIVGFPGEREDDIEDLASYLETSPLTQLHVFPYSDRPGTAASAMPSKVHGLLIRERGARIRAIGQQLADDFRRSQAGSIRRALTIEDGSVAVTDNGLRVEIGAGRRPNEHVHVRLAFEGARLTGELVEAAAPAAVRA